MYPYIAQSAPSSLTVTLKLAHDNLGTDGIVDHRDVFFSDEEKAANTKLCTCVSRVIGGSITVGTADR
jgi:hypothetical protein